MPASSTTGASIVERPPAGATAAVDADRPLAAAIAADGRDGIWITLVDRAGGAGARPRAVDDAASPPAPTCRWPATTLAVKDNIDVAGLPTTAGCPAYAYDADARRAGRRARCVDAGRRRRRQDEPGPVRHRPGRHALAVRRLPERPLARARSPAGRAPARPSPWRAGLVDLALGTDTAGSGRVPAACNGIVGLKPTRGRISTAGVVPACRSLDCVSVFARDGRRGPPRRRSPARPALIPAIRGAGRRRGAPGCTGDGCCASASRRPASSTFDGDPTGRLASLRPSPGVVATGGTTRGRRPRAVPRRRRPALRRLVRRRALRGRGRVRRRPPRRRRPRRRRDHRRRRRAAGVAGVPRPDRAGPARGR